MNYVYKVTKKLLKSDLLNKIFPVGDANGEMGTYAKPVRFEEKSKLVESMIGYLNNRKWQMNAGVYDDEKRKELAEQGLVFEERWVDTDDGREQVLEGYDVVVDEDLLNDLTPGLLMFDAGGEFKNMLYVGSATDTYPFVYFSTDIIDQHCPEIIKALREEGFIRKTKFVKKVEPTDTKIDA